MVLNSDTGIILKLLHENIIKPFCWCFWLRTEEAMEAQSDWKILHMVSYHHMLRARAFSLESKFKIKSLWFEIRIDLLLC